MCVRITGLKPLRHIYEEGKMNVEDERLKGGRFDIDIIQEVGLFLKNITFVLCYDINIFQWLPNFRENYYLEIYKTPQHH